MKLASLAFAALLAALLAAPLAQAQNPLALGKGLRTEGGNNHRSVVQFKGQWFLFYHRWLETPGGGLQQDPAACDGRVPVLQRGRNHSQDRADPARRG